MKNMAKRILVVEDEVTLHKALVDSLMQAGYETLSALDGELGWELVSKQIPDLVLLDIILPKLDGFEVLAKMKENPKTADVPVIILTNLGDIPDIQKALDLGASTYLVKADFHLEDVLKKVEQTLSN
jgi:DNA-binding response OmpR family regulator